MKPYNHVPNFVDSGYHHRVVPTHTLKETVEETVKWLRKQDKKTPFDALAFRGLSGTMVAPSVAMRLNKTMIIVRKDAEISSSHSTLRVLGDINARSYVILDDFIATGRTATEIVEWIKTKSSARCIGVCEYNRLYKVDYALKTKWRLDDDGQA